MRARTMSIGGIVALAVIAVVLILSRVGFRQCGQWVVSTAVGFFTQQDVSPDPAGWSGAEPARAADLSPPEERDRPGEARGEARKGAEPDAEPEKPVLQLAKVENKKEAAENGLKVISGGAQDMMASSEGSPAVAQPTDAESAPEQVRQTEGAIVTALGQLTGQFEDSDDPDADESPDTPTAEASAPAVSAEKTATPECVAPKASEPGHAAAGHSSDPLRQKYTYSSDGRRDPFRALISEGDEDGISDRLNLDEARLVGILWGGKNNIALLEDLQNTSFCLREGDRVQEGRLNKIRSNSVVFSRFRFGRTETVVLELEDKKAGGS